MAILQTQLPFDPDPHVRLPGIQPTDAWVIQDEAYAPQMAARCHLLQTRREDVLALTSQGRAAADELLDTVWAEAATWPGFKAEHTTLVCPDGRRVHRDDADPLGTAGQVVQEDLCLMEAGPDGHVLTGAFLCFPASWTLAEKIGRPLAGIHAPVPEYNADLTRRVQRLFDALRGDTVLMRYNALWYDDPELFQPKPENAPRGPSMGQAAYLRSERQTLRRLPKTQAVVFAIHTYVLPADAPDARKYQRKA